MNTLLGVAIAALSGLVTWSFLEYAIHNWAGHLPKGKGRFSREHLKHHADVTYFASARDKAIVAAQVMALITPLAVWAVGWLYGLVFSCCVVATYLAYEVTHRRIHTHPPKGWYGRLIRRNHLAHHFSSPAHNHGVTSTIWDHVFRTHRPSPRVRVPRKQAMVWLCDESGEVKAELRSDYELVGRARRERSEGRAEDAIERAAIAPSGAGGIDVSGQEPVVPVG